MEKIRKRNTRSRVNTDNLPDECLANVFQFLNLFDRESCSLVCHRWYRIEGQIRRRLCLKSKRHQPDLLPNYISSLSTRFDSLTSLAFKYVTIGDDALVLISLRCSRTLTSLKLHGCRDLTDEGVAGFAVNCKGLKEFHVEWCKFGAKGINAIVDNSSFLEDLSLLNLGGLAGDGDGDGDGDAMSIIGPGVAASSLKTICIGQYVGPHQLETGEYYWKKPNGQCFGPLIIASKNLRALKIYGSSGDWDKVFEEAMVKNQVTGLVEIHLKTIEISDAALVSISKCLDLEILHLAEIHNCTNAGLVQIAYRCKRLRVLHIQRWAQDYRIGDEGISAIAQGCPKLEELILINISIARLSLNMLSSENCPNLESLALCNNDAVQDAEMSLIAAKFMALKNLYIQGCAITDQGVLALSSGSPNLVDVGFISCRALTLDALNRLKAERDSMVVRLVLETSALWVVLRHCFNTQWSSTSKKQL